MLRISKRRFSLCFFTELLITSQSNYKYEEETIHHNSADGGIRAAKQRSAQGSQPGHNTICCVQN